MSNTGGDAAIIVGYLLATLAISIMGLRLYMRRYRRQSFVISDYITLFCCLLLVYIMNITLVFGTLGNVANTYMAGEVPSRADIKRSQMSSKVTYAGAIIYFTYIWCQKAVVLCFINRLLGVLPWPYIWIRVMWAILGVTYITLLLLFLTICRPLSLYFQVYPDPGPCIRSTYQISAHAVFNCVTDVMLIILPIHWLLKIRRPWYKRAQLIGLFSIGIVLVVISALRFPFHQGSLDTSLQTILSPIEELLSALVANVPTLYSLRRARQPETPPHPTQPPPKRFPRAVDSIIIMQTVDVEESRTDDQTLSTTITDRALSTTMADRDLNDDSDGHLVRNGPE
ncbi:hypothetical protein ASPTUDRAFT_193517 [Aspergillus tubingensis CBS 134.48]|uniref:Rhodopsin domain-containing protein n=1 Tax=Aspergillus tubingensis (strain CBS 134.48) TaxID=767770 RepID=A0A1L9MSQ1_ASPTC|nr:hypothetical protein ASPTUDRAFT_193517 [Aspergillus tubingensis CBS 134.48]